MWYNKKGEKMDRQAIIDKAWETVDEIRECALYRKYIASLNKLNEDSNIHPLVENFNYRKAVYDDLKSQGTLSTALSDAAKELAIAKDTLFSLPEYQEYLANLKDLNEYLHSISSSLQQILDECSVGKKQKCPRR